MFSRFAIISTITIALAACGGGSGGGPTPPMVSDPTPPQTPIPPTDHGDTRPDATRIALNESFAGMIASAMDSDYFRLPVEAEGILTITTTGNANPHIRAYDAAGVEIPGLPGSYIITITPTILAKGNYIFIEFYDGIIGETYSGSTELIPSPSLSLADKLRLYRNGNPALYMTPVQMKEAAERTLLAATHFVGVAEDFHPHGSRQPHETTYEVPEYPAWVEAGYRTSSYRPVMRHNGVNVFTATRRFINPLAEGPSTCVGEGCVPPPSVQYTALEDVTALGGWMDYSYFEVVSGRSCNTANAGCSGNQPDYDVDSHYISYDVFARPSGTNPIGSGSASWIGIMTGISFGSNPNSVVRFVGDAHIEIDDLAAPTVNVAFTNIHDLTSEEEHHDLMWSDLAVIDGKFGESHTERVDLGNGGYQYETTGIGAAFAGPNHEEVVGTFSLDYIDLGAFGAKRQ